MTHVHGWCNVDFWYDAGLLLYICDYCPFQAHIDERWWLIRGEFTINKGEKADLLQMAVYWGQFDSLPVPVLDFICVSIYRQQSSCLKKVVMVQASSPDPSFTPET